MTKPIINILQGHHPTLPEADVNVVIDVIRAFTTCHIAFEQGAREVLLARELDRAFALKQTRPDYLLAGERGALKVEGFDLGNSPFEVSTLPLKDRGLILSTTNGVRATLHALGAAEVLVTGFSNAATTARYLQHKTASAKPQTLNLLASHPTGDEDVACAEYIRDLLLPSDDPVTAPDVARRIRQSRAAEKFLDPARPQFDSRDIELCERPRPSDFVMVVAMLQDLPLLRKRRLP